MTWQKVKLGEVCEVITKGTTPTTMGLQFVESGIPFMRVLNIQNGEVDLSNTLFIDSNTDEVLKRSRIKPRDLLISIAGTIGRSALIPNDAPAMNCNQAVAIVRLNKDELQHKFLLHWLNTEQAQRAMSGAQVTGTISNLSLGQVSKLEIPLPPLAEQKRLAAILDRADELRRARRESLARLDELAQSLFLELFGDPATNPKGWDMIALKSAASQEKNAIRRGPFGGALKKEFFVKHGYKVYEQGNVIYDDFERGKYFIPETMFNKLSMFAVKENDILISCSGTVGKVAIVPIIAFPIRIPGIF